MPMLCDSCKKQPAAVESLILENRRVVREDHLCESCAAEQGLPVKPSITISAILSTLLDQQPAAHPAKPTARRSTTCPKCGMSFAQFRSKGRLGCPHDYVLFGKGLRPLLDRIQAGPKHTGKIPRRAGRQISLERNLSKHREKLKKAIRTENYEEAARLRDEILELERSTHTDGSR